MSNTFKFKKAVQSLNYFAQKAGGAINYMKAIKLVWLADRLHVRTYGRTITNDQYFAMKNGPVASGTKDIILKSAFISQEIIDYSNQYLSEANKYEFQSITSPDLTVFSKTDLRILEAIFGEFGHLSQFQLSDFSHDFPEWKRFQENLKDDSTRSFPINDNDFFEKESDNKTFSQNEELLALSKETYHETV